MDAQQVSSLPKIAAAIAISVISVMRSGLTASDTQTEGLPLVEGGGQRTGCQWEMLPYDLPTYSTVYRYFSIRAKLRAN